MRQSLLSVALAAFMLSLTACSDEATTTHDEHDHDGADHADHEHASDLPADLAVYPVACGCSQGGACANLVEVDGKYIPLEGDLGLGAMEFCGQDGLHAAMTGAVEDGAFVATAYELRK